MIRTKIIYLLRIVLVFCGMANVNMGYSQEVDMSLSIVLLVEKGENIMIDISAYGEREAIRVVSGKTDTTLIIGESSYTRRYYYADSETMTVYGKVRTFDCMNNEGKIKDINLRNNLEIYILACSSNNLTVLDVTGLKDLEYLSCHTNNISQLNLTELKNLKNLGCSNNNLSNLDIENLTKLNTLSFSSNQISNIDLNKLSELRYLNCHNNKLKELDISKNPDLENILLYGNDLSTDELNKIYCALSDRTDKEIGIIRTLYDDNDKNYESVIKSDSDILYSKNWDIRYWFDFMVFPATEGDYACMDKEEKEENDTLIDSRDYIASIENKINNELNIKIYPNPVTRTLSVESSKHINSIEVLDISGKSLLRKDINSKETKIDFSVFNSGVYFIRVYSQEGVKAYKIVKSQ